MKTKVRLGLYGCNVGRTAQIVRAAESSFPGVVSVAACFDIDPQKVAAMSEPHGARPCASLQEFLAAEFDVAVISLPPHLHPDAFAACAAAGKDIYLEKPVCVDDAGRASLIAAARRYQPLCYVGLSNQYIPPFAATLEIARREGNGRLLAFHHHWFNASDGRPPERPNWRHVREQSGGELNQHCCHLFHYMRLLCGNPVSVFAMAHTSPSFNPAHEEEELSVMFRFQEGHLATFGLSQRAHRTHQWGQVHFENLAVQYEWAGRSTLRVFRTRPRAADEIMEWDMDANPLPLQDDYTFRQLRDFLDAYIHGRPMPITVADGVHAYDIVKAIRQSVASRAETPVEPYLE